MPASRLEDSIAHYLCVLFCVGLPARAALKLLYSESFPTTIPLVLRLLHHMSAQQGVAMSSPSSVKKIPVRGWRRRLGSPRALAQPH